MNLSFTQKFYNGAPTFFPYLIWESLTNWGMESHTTRNAYAEEYAKWHGKTWDHVPANYGSQSKTHTLRRDSSDRWKPGRKIHFQTSSRFHPGGVFRFAPSCTVRAIERVKLFWDGVRIIAMVGNRVLSSAELTTMAINDGFEDEQHLAKWFFHDVANASPSEMATWEGKLIHWTRFLYTPKAAELC